MGCPYGFLPSTASASASASLPPRVISSTSQQSHIVKVGNTHALPCKLPPETDAFSCLYAFFRALLRLRQRLIERRLCAVAAKPMTDRGRVRCGIALRLPNGDLKVLSIEVGSHEVG